MNETSERTASAPWFLGVSPLSKNRGLTPPRSETAHSLPREESASVNARLAIFSIDAHQHELQIAVLG